PNSAAPPWLRPQPHQRRLHAAPPPSANRSPAGGNPSPNTISPSPAPPPPRLLRSSSGPHRFLPTHVSSTAARLVPIPPYRCLRVGWKAHAPLPASGWSSGHVLRLVADHGVGRWLASDPALAGLDPAAGHPNLQHGHMAKPRWRWALEMHGRSDGDGAWRREAEWRVAQGAAACGASSVSSTSPPCSPYSSWRSSPRGLSPSLSAIRSSSLMSRQE
ncbi:unnamed protein product, partial [Urochloa humidicola]